MFAYLYIVDNKQDLDRIDIEIDDSDVSFLVANQKNKDAVIDWLAKNVNKNRGCFVTFTFEISFDPEKTEQETITIDLQ